MINRINFRQPKYIFPLIMFIPLCFLIYYVMEMFGSDNPNNNVVATDQINSSLPDAQAKEPGNKFMEMQRRISEDGSYSAIAPLGDEKEEKINLEHGYSEEELDRLDAEEAERLRQQKQMEEMERSLALSRRHINSSKGNDRYNDYDSYDAELEEIQQRSMARQRQMERSLGLNQNELLEAENKRKQDSIQYVQKLERERNRPLLVLKSQDANADKFNTLENEKNNLDAPLIRAMIDQTTKATDGTRIRFKLLDNISIKDVRLPKGTYLYGTVTGFREQRVLCNITSVLVGNKFLKIDLSVFDNDGMEGFYVPASAFRDLVKEATSRTVQQNISFSNGASGVTGEAIALQALQNLYNSATSALSSNIRKNRAKIKYNTIVYLINSQEAR